MRLSLTASTLEQDAADMENGKSRLEQTQDGLDEVKVIMLNNIEKVDERSHKLSELEDRADDLHALSKSFEKNTEKVKNQKRCENKKMKFIGIGIGVALAVIIIGVVLYFVLG